MRSTSGPALLAVMFFRSLPPTQVSSASTVPDEFLITGVHEAISDFMEHTPDRFLRYVNHAGQAVGGKPLGIARKQKEGNTPFMGG